LIVTVPCEVPSYTPTICAMAQFAELFGDKLLGKAGEVATADALAGKKGVMIYFSAHWCPPCRGFTPKLAEYYKKHAASKGFELVFASSDKDQSAFDSYYGEMPWLALPYAERDRKETLSKKYKVNGIPSLVVLGPGGETTTTNGRDKVMEDPDCENFPWSPLTFSEALGESLIKQDGSSVSAASLKGKTIGLYFSAHWCPPCRGFTPKLKEFYTEYSAADPNFELVFVSSDKDEAGMMSYFKEDHGAYLALPYANRKGKGALSEMCSVEGIPSLAVIGPDEKIINVNARSKVAAGAKAVLESGWFPPMVGDMEDGPEAAGKEINECPSIVVLCAHCSDDVKAGIKKTLEPIGKKYFDEGKKTDEDPKYICLMATSSGGAADQIGNLTKKEAGASIAAAVEAKQPVILLFDIPDRGGFYVSNATSCTTEGIEEFLRSKEAGKEKRMQLG